ncbi:lamin tail domain-containing protein [Phytomonospora sp. NPDC050363]|uniref:lamin tail domain-containing protein n=1 Tax=Phytomonospora sp. NPDC050363 TaxID=3155642 RepID=UPI0033FCB091
MNTRRLTVAAAALAAMLIGQFALASAAHAATDPKTLHIGYINYDSAGRDSGSNTSLNDEWIRLHNNTTGAITLTGYKIKDKAGHTFTFPTFKLGAGKSVALHTGKGTNSAAHLYWGKTWYVWNNTSDTAYLVKPTGGNRDTCSYPTSDNPPGVGCHSR